MADRGASEALGFVLIFSLIVFSVGAVYVAGFSDLQDVRDYERVNNAERAFEVLSDNVRDLTTHEAPSRATEIKLADATLETGAPVAVNVSGERYDQPEENFTFEFEVTPIVYDAGSGSRLLYSNGAVLRESPSGTVVVDEPNVLLSSERTVIPVVQTRPSGPGSVTGSSTVLVRTERASSTLLTPETTGSYNVTMNVTTTSTARTDAWERYLRTKSDLAECARSGPDETTVTCRIVETDHVYVTLTRIDVAFE